VDETDALDDGLTAERAEATCPARTPSGRHVVEELSAS